jgi:recombination protein RecA
MSANKWMSKLLKEANKAKASIDIPSPSSNVIQLTSPSFNWSTGSNGIPVGKAICLFGGENGGKSLIMQLLFAEIQRKDPEAICILFDAEFSHNPEWFKKLGGDPSRLLVVQSNSPTDIFDFIWGGMFEMLQNGAPIKGIGIDSIRSILYPKDIKDVSTNVTMGGSGSIYLPSALKRILPVIREYNITTILLQQVQEEMDQYKAMRNPYKLPDGRALKHFCDLLIQIDRLDSKAGVIESGETIAGGKAQTGHKIRLKNKKNRVGSPYRVAEFTLDYNKGIIDTDNEAVNLGMSLGLIKHPLNPDTGKENVQMWQFKSYPAVRGDKAVREWFSSNPKILAELVSAFETVDETAVLARNQALEEPSFDSDEDLLV